MAQKNKTLLVTGCTRGIGYAISTYFAELGFHVAGCARNKDDIHRMNSLFRETYPNQSFYFESVDVTDKKALALFCNHAQHKLGPIEILVNNAGIFVPGNVTDEKDGTLEHLLATNVQSAYYTTQAILPGMLSAQAGHIFNMCSIASKEAYANGGSYTISKFALLGFSKQLRMELEQTPVKVTAILAGAVLTSSWEGTNLPESRFINPTDIAKTIFHIYSTSASTSIEEVLIRPQPGDI